MCVIIAKNKEGEDIEDCLFKDISINHNKDGVDDDFNVDIDSGNDDNDCINSDDINCNDSDEYIDEYTDDGKCTGRENDIDVVNENDNGYSDNEEKY